MRPLTCLLLAALVPGVALAADVTELPPNLRGDVRLRYDGNFQQVGLEEEGEVVGLRNVLHNDLTIVGEFAVYEGIALHLGFPIGLARSITYPSAREMLYEPGSDSGSYLNGDRLDPAPQINSGGLAGVWIGLAASPFREEWSKGLPITMRFDFAVRTPSASQTLYSEARGANPGGVATKLAAAFSVRKGFADPYVKLQWVHELPADVEVYAVDGTRPGTIRVNEGAKVDMIFGSEFIAWENTEKNHRIAVDLRAGFGYRAPAERASGFYLPSVLDATKGISVTQSEYIEFLGGLALDVHLSKYFGFRLGGDGRYVTPHRVEHPYNVRTDGRSFGSTWYVELVGRVRTKRDRP